MLFPFVCINFGSLCPMLFRRIKVNTDKQVQRRLICYFHCFFKICFLRCRPFNGTVYHADARIRKHFHQNIPDKPRMFRFSDYSDCTYSRSFQSMTAINSYCHIKFPLYYKRAISGKNVNIRKYI